LDRSCNYNLEEGDSGSVVVLRGARTIYYLRLKEVLLILIYLKRIPTTSQRSKEHMTITTITILTLHIPSYAIE